MRIPAVIFCHRDSSPRCVAGLPVIDRLVVAAHRAGAESITLVSETPLPRLERTVGLGIPVKLAGRRPEFSGPVLVLSNRLLVQSVDLKLLIERRGRLVSRHGVPLPAGVVTEWSGRGWEDQLSGLPGVAAQGVAELIGDDRSAAAAARGLWASLSSPADGLVDTYFNRSAGRWLSKILVHTSVSPNQVSVVATLLGLVSARFFAQGDYASALWGAILLQGSAVVDCVDGDLARVMFKESRLGKWLDLAGDQLVHIAVFAGIGVGVYRAGGDAPVLLLAASAAVGAVISFAVVVHGQSKPESRGNLRLQRLADAAANRDFSVLLILLAWLGKLAWFLWVAAIGVHLFWLLALGARWLNQPAAASLNPDREYHS